MFGHNGMHFISYICSYCEPIIAGVKLRSMSNNVAEMYQKYDSYGDPNPVCGIGSTANAGKKCQIEFVAPRDMEPPVLIHYEVDNFYQNHRRYITSRDDTQLLGSIEQTEYSASFCEPLVKLGNVTLNPCGLQANTLFNDVITLQSGNDTDGFPLVMVEEGIAWQGDLEFKYRQPDGFRYETCTSCDDCSCDGPDWSCEDRGPYIDPDGICHRYFYPNDNTTQYLHETYPMVVSPIEGVLNHHFVVWMRAAALPKFRKLYGWIDQHVAEGTVLKFEVEANWEVQSFRGGKALVVSDSHTFGGKNEELANNFIIVGGMCMFFAIIFGLKHTFRPRKLADKEYLLYKED